MKRLKGFALNRLQEPSTWRALVGLFTLFGVALKPDQIDAIAGAGVAAYLVLEAFLPDHFSGGSDPDPGRMPPSLPPDRPRNRKGMARETENFFLGPD